MINEEHVIKLRTTHSILHCNLCIDSSIVRFMQGITNACTNE